MKMGREKAKEKTPNSALQAFCGGYPKGYVARRALAALADFTVISFIYQFAVVYFGAPDMQRYLEMQQYVTGLPATDPLVLERVLLYQACFITALCIGTVYEAVCMLLLKATPGKWMFGLRVVNVAPQRNPVVSKLMLVLRAGIKALSIYLLSAIPFVFMCITLFGNSEGKSGFDTFVGTKVIDVKRQNK